MQEYNDSEYKRLLRQRLDELPVEGDNEVWAELEKRLDDTKSRKVGSWFNTKMLTIGILFLLLTGLSLYLITKSAEEKNNSAISENISPLQTEKSASGLNQKESEKMVAPAVPTTNASVTASVKPKSKKTREEKQPSGPQPSLNKQKEKPAGNEPERVIKEKQNKDIENTDQTSNLPSKKDSVENNTVIYPEKVVENDTTKDSKNKDDLNAVSPPVKPGNPVRSTYIGFEIGLGFNNFSFDNYRRRNIPVSPSFSVFADIPYGKLFSFSPSLGFINLPSAIMVNYIDSPRKIIYNSNVNAIHLLQLGLNNRVVFKNKIAITAGIGITRAFKFYTISNEEMDLLIEPNGNEPSSKISRSEAVTPYIKRFDLNFNLGVEYSIGPYRFGIRALNGLSDITLSTPQVYRMNTLSFNISYWIKQ